jgi:hypothetical protein
VSTKPTHRTTPTPHSIILPRTWSIFTRLHSTTGCRYPSRLRHRECTSHRQ